MLLHQLVNKPIAPTHPLQQQALGTVVEKAGIVPGDTAGAVEDNAEGEVLDAGPNTFKLLSQ
jgi:hypothetical protein